MVELWSNWLIPGLAGLLLGLAAGIGAWHLLRRQSDHESLISDVTRNAATMLWMADADGTTTYGNNAWRCYLGIASNEDLEQAWISALHPDDKAAYGKAWRRAMEEHEPLSMEYRLRRHDGVYCWLFESIRQRFDDSGRFNGLVGSSFDITRRKDAEQALRASEQRFRNLFTSAPAGIWQENYSATKIFIDQLRADGVVDFDDHFDKHPDDLDKAIDLIEVVDVNQAVLDIYKAGSMDRQAFIEEVERPERRMFWRRFHKQELARLAAGDSRPVVDYEDLAFDGMPLRIRSVSFVADEFKSTWECVTSCVLDVTENHQAMVERQASEDRYRSLFDETPVGILEEDYSLVKLAIDALVESGVHNIEAYLLERPDEAKRISGMARVVAVNQAMLDMFGAPDQESLVAYLDRQKASYEWATRYAREIGHLLNGHHRYLTELQETAFDDTTFDIKSVTLLPDAHAGTWSRVITTFEDITVRKRTEAALQSSQARYRDLFDQTPISIWEEDFSLVKSRIDELREFGITDIGAYLDEHPEVVEELSELIRVIDVNQVTVDLYGGVNATSVVEAARQSDWRIRWAPIHANMVSVMARGGTRAEIEAFDQTMEGRDFAVRAVSVLPDSHAGTWSRVICAIEDISRLRDAEEGRRQSEQRFEQLVRMLPDPVMLTEQERVTYVNKAFVDLIGVGETNDVIGRPITDVLEVAHQIGVDTNDSIRRFLDDAASAASLAQARLLRLDDQDGEPIDVEVAASRMPETHIARWVVVLRDITDRLRHEDEMRTARDEAESANRAKSEFVANMSHELRTPLNAIIGFSDLMMNELFGKLGDPRYADYMVDIHDSGEHLLAVINDILDLSKVEAGQMELSEDIVGIEELTYGVARLMQARIDENGVTLDVDVPDNYPALLVDGRKIKQVLLNLLSNAVKFTSQMGTIVLRAELDPDGEILLSVIDDGIGMTEDEITLALEPFRQVDGSLSRRHEGTGLGLPLSRSLVELHGGELKIVSRRGEGTAITVVLPAWRASTTEPLRDRLSATIS
ncbi:MAG: PAS domain S-box protein [Pseudomonadota bacterium]